MKKYEEKIRKFHSDQKGFVFIESFCLERTLMYDRCIDCNLKITLRSRPFDEMDKKLCILFKGIKDIKIKDVGGMFTWLLIISDISDHQLEDINFHVKDSEEEVILFYCKSFEYEFVFP
ncbi:MAG: hypothetical protein ABFD91_04640 [Anaerohalosphaeraceae bacterium]